MLHIACACRVCISHSGGHSLQGVTASNGEPTSLYQPQGGLIGAGELTCAAERQTPRRAACSAGRGCTAVMLTWREAA
eukprot:3094578-Prymnesium_polylepis.2